MHDLGGGVDRVERVGVALRLQNLRFAVTFGAQDLSLFLTFGLKHRCLTLTLGDVDLRVARTLGLRDLGAARPFCGHLPGHCLGDRGWRLNLADLHRRHLDAPAVGDLIELDLHQVIDVVAP